MSKNAHTKENLQEALSMELAAVQQYLSHTLTAEDWGLDKLAAKMREEMQEELGHAEEYARRLIFLGGTPVMKPAKTPAYAKSLKAMFEADLADEKDAIAFYSEAARAASQENDIGSRNLFETTALDEEGHMAWLDLQLSLLDRMGEPAYIAMQISGSGAQ